MKHRIALTFGICLLAVACAPRIFTKSDVSYDLLLLDYKECAARSKNRPNTGYPGVFSHPSPGVTAGVSFGAGFLAGMARSRAVRAATENCMEEKGYEKYELTDEKKKVYASLQTASDKETFLRRFYEEMHGDAPLVFHDPVAPVTTHPKEPEPKREIHVAAVPADVIPEVPPAPAPVEAKTAPKTPVAAAPADVVPDATPAPAPVEAKTATEAPVAAVQSDNVPDASPAPVTIELEPKQETPIAAATSDASPAPAPVEPEPVPETQVTVKTLAEAPVTQATPKTSPPRMAGSLSSVEIKGLLSGVEIGLGVYEIRLKGNGKLDGDWNHYASGYGKWWVANNKHCIEWSSWGTFYESVDHPGYPPRPGCFSVIKTGTRYEFVDPDNPREKLQFAVERRITY